jgi:hypothetical protein
MLDFVKIKDNQWQRLANHDTIDAVFILYCNAFSGESISPLPKIGIVILGLFS